jgi:uncharacterized protein with HEPN domain
MRCKRRSLPFRDFQTHFQNILESIGNIDKFLAGMDYEPYRTDRKTRSAVERELQIITEAAIRLSPDAETLCPGPDWKASAERETSFATSITALTAKLSGIPSRLNYLHCAKPF